MINCLLKRHVFYCALFTAENSVLSQASILRKMNPCEKIDNMNQKWDYNEETERKKTKWDSSIFNSSISSFTAKSNLLLFKNSDLDYLLPSEGFIIIELNENLSDQTPNTLFSNINPDQVDKYSQLFLKPDDYVFFRKINLVTESESLSLEEAKELKILRLMLNLKNGDLNAKRNSMRILLEKAPILGSDIVLSKVLSILLLPSLEDHERHLFLKIVDRLFLYLESDVRPFIPKILLVIQPLLLNSSFLIRTEGKEILGNLCKAAGGPSMINALYPDLCHVDENVRNNACRIFAICGSTLGISSILPFLKAMMLSKKTWYCHFSALKIIHQLALSIGRLILNDADIIFDCISIGFQDDLKVRAMAALTLSAIAEVIYPIDNTGITKFINDIILGVKHSKGKFLGVFTKSAKHLLLFMNKSQANFVAMQIMPIIIKELSSKDIELKLNILKFTHIAILTDSLPIQFLRDEFMPVFISVFFNEISITERAILASVLEIFATLPKYISISELLDHVFPSCKHINENVRNFSALCLNQIIITKGSSTLDASHEIRIFDSLIYILQSMQTDECNCIEAIGKIIFSFGLRAKPYLHQISNTILWHLSNRSAKIRSNAARLISCLAKSIYAFEENILYRLFVVLYENLGEEYPDVLASIIAALKTILKIISPSKCNPPISELILKVSPILRNRHEKVQEATVNFIRFVSQKSPNAVSPREWMRIAFELLELLRTHRKSIRRNAIITFGYISRAIGPFDVLSSLLNNLKVQERQNRICTTVAIAVIAESCSPFTVVPSLMNEYRVPELNVQNGVLKAFAFMFEYIGELAKDYIYAVSPLLEDALIERDLVHRQIASTTLKHMSIDVTGFGCEDAILHLFNLLWPNIFETSPHVINSVIEAIEAVILALGSVTVFQYMLQGLFHPARRIRDVYWRCYNICYIASPDSLVASYPPLPILNNKHKLKNSILDTFV